MKMSSLPRYLRIAKWLLDQDRFMTSKDISEHFNISVKTVCADFFLMRKRPDIIEAEWRRSEWVGYGKIQYRIRILHIHPYWLDARNCPRRHDEVSPILVSDLMPLWRMLVTTHWHCLDLHEVSRERTEPDRKVMDENGWLCLPQEKICGNNSLSIANSVGIRCGCQNV